MTKVFIIQSSEYENHSVVAVAATMEKAIEIRNNWLKLNVSPCTKQEMEDYLQKPYGYGQASSFVEIDGKFYQTNVDEDDDDNENIKITEREVIE